MSPQLIIAGVLLASAAGTGGWFVYRWQEAKVLTAQTAAKENERQAVQAALRAKSALEALASSEDVSRKRNLALQQSQKDEALFRSAFEALYAQSQIAKDWGNAIVPNDVRCLRRKSNPALADNLQCPNGATGTNPGTEPKRSNERPPIKREQLRTERLTAM